jgi:hypothetical protein
MGGFCFDDGLGPNVNHIARPKNRPDDPTQEDVKKKKKKIIIIIIIQFRVNTLSTLSASCDLEEGFDLF